MITMLLAFCEIEIVCNILKINIVTFDLLMSSSWINVSINK